MGPSPAVPKEARNQFGTVSSWSSWLHSCFSSCSFVQVHGWFLHFLFPRGQQSSSGAGYLTLRYLLTLPYLSICTPVFSPLRKEAPRRVSPDLVPRSTANGSRTFSVFVSDPSPSRAPLLLDNLRVGHRPGLIDDGDDGTGIQRKPEP